MAKLSADEIFGIYARCATGMEVAHAIESAARREAFKEAAEACEAEHVGLSINDSCKTPTDDGYNTALRHASGAILALAEKEAQ